MVESCFRPVEGASPAEDDPDAANLTPAVRRLLGIAAGAGGVEGYHEHLAARHGGQGRRQSSPPPPSLSYL
jgi:hypothetical protein